MALSIVQHFLAKLALMFYVCSPAVKGISRVSSSIEAVPPIADLRKRSIGERHVAKARPVKPANALFHGGVGFAESAARASVAANTGSPIRPFGRKWRTAKA